MMTALLGVMSSRASNSLEEARAGGRSAAAPSVDIQIKRPRNTTLRIVYLKLYFVCSSISDMRVCLAFVLFAFAASISDAALGRQKRFLQGSLHDRLLGLPEHLMRHLFRGDGTVGVSLRSPVRDPFYRTTNFRVEPPPDATHDTAKKGLTPNIHRELEDPEDAEETRDNAEEVIVDRPFEPEPEKIPEEEETEKIPPHRIPIFIDPFGLTPFSFGLHAPWWKGPNVCVERSEVDDSEPDGGSGFLMINFESTQCSPTETTYICTKKIRNNQVRKTIVMKHQCCHGFQRQDGKPGCSKVSLDSLMDTIKNMEANKFADMISSTNLAEKLDTENFTVFAPINDAIADFKDESEDNEIMNSRPPKDYSYLAGGHLVEGIVDLGALQDDDILQSVNGKTTIRINKYRPLIETITTANCVPVIKKNNMAKNGVVHITSSVLPLPRKTVADVITASPKLSVFSTLLEQHDDLLSEMRDSKQSWTVFVPTDKAFEKMNSEMLQKLLTGEGCVESILKSHMLKGTLCSSAIVGRARVRNAIGAPLSLTQDEADKFEVEGVKISGTDILGTNGVVHFIDEVIIPPEAQTIMEALRKSNRQDLISLIQLANLEPTFENLRNVTFFVPNRDAIEAISNETREAWNDDPEKLRQTLLYHVVVPEISAAEFRHNKELPSLAEDQSVRVQFQEMFPGLAMGVTAQCTPIVKHNYEVCGAMLHVVDKVLTPPKDTILETLKSMGGYTTFTKLMESTDLERKLEEWNAGPYTILAPTDKAFDRFDKDTLKELLENSTRAEQILKMHVLPEALCCSGVTPVLPFQHRYVRTMEGNLVSLHRSSRRETVRFGSARAVQCDVMTKGGIVHTVNRVILPNRRPAPSLFDMDIFGGIFK